MAMNRFELCHHILSIMAIVIITFGVLLALLYRTPILAPIDKLISSSFWDNLADVPIATHKKEHFLVALTGAMMASWGILLYAIVKVPFRRREQWAWLAIAGATLIWFMIDESFSLYYGVCSNAIINLALLLPLVVSLAGTYRTFFPGVTDNK
jgi:hypothetical protein